MTDRDDLNVAALARALVELAEVVPYVLDLCSDETQLVVLHARETLDRERAT